MSARTTGISITPRRGLARAAFPQAIFISLCTNLRSRREGRRLAELTTGALLLVLGTALSIIGILFSPFLCVGIPLLVVGVILIIAEGGQVTKAPPAMYPGYPPGYAYPPYIPSPPAQPAPPAAGAAGPPSAAGTGRFCTSCGSPIATGIAVNFQVNGRDYLVPMAIEEPSVVAAASNAARMARERGGFSASTSGPIMIGQIQLVGVSDPHGARMTILHHKDEILSIANEKDPMLVKVGGGAKDVEVRVVDTKRGHMVVTHLVVDCRDAMGANAVNTMAEAIAPHIEKWTGGRVYLRIISNLAVRRLARARAVFAKAAIRTEDIPGEDVVEGILEAYAFADADPFRCATHNKGIMNGIDAVVVATGNDWRAIEAGAHAYAAWKSGGYRSLTSWERDSHGGLVGTIELT